MDSHFQDLMKRGKMILVDTKTPRKMAAVTKKIDPLKTPGLTETDPFKSFIKRVISEKPKKDELVKDFKRFIDVAEAEL